ADPFRGTPPCAEPPLPRADGRELMYRWMKHEPLGPYLDEAEAEKELEREEKGESPPAAPQPRYPSVESNDLEPDNSTSEDTGSSEGPSPGDALDRYCNHLGYEPESLGDNLYVCIPCGKGFPSSEQLNAHVEAHNEEELYHKAAAEQAVPFLDKGGPGLGDILRPYRCSSCDKSYKDPATLRQHEKTHWLTRPYPCTICGKKFTQRGTMTRHMRSHLGLKPFACDACGMRFTRQYRLTEHMRIHSGEKPYEGTDGFSAMARLTADQLGLKQEQAAELLSHTSHFLSDPKAMESLYPLAKFTAEHLGLSQDKAAEVLAQAPHLRKRTSNKVTLTHVASRPSLGPRLSALPGTVWMRTGRSPSGFALGSARSVQPRPSRVFARRLHDPQPVACPGGTRVALRSIPGWDTPRWLAPRGR
ncbi:PREDICTED: hypermethylated in cancer 1 protein, partial [Tinamus guttatus]|uniref:hypermethylated in cancer 1 protein n=1 Tax=Tinamus guttatus TaxID=94827 RepID=UPI00052F056B